MGNSRDGGVGGAVDSGSRRRAAAAAAVVVHGGVAGLSSSVGFRLQNIASSAVNYKSGG